MGVKLKVTAVVCAAPLLGCSGIDVDGANRVDEAAGQQFQSLDASCTLAIDAMHSWYDPSIGGEISTDAYGSCLDDSSLEYRVTAKTPKNESLTLWDWAPAIFDTYIGTYELPVGSPEGTYTVTVEARRSGTTDTVASKVRKLVIGRACDHAVLRATPAGAAPGQLVELTPDISCPEGIEPEWRVTVQKPGGGSVSLPWVHGSSTLWNTTGLNAGTATLTLAVRTFGNTVTDLSAKQTYVLGAACTAGTLVANGTGTTRTLTATSSCLGGGTPVYRFSSVAPDGSVSPLRDFDANAAFVWDVTGLNGTFTARVDVRAAELPEQQLSSKSAKVNLGDACTKLTLPSLWGTYSTAESLVATATPNCSLAEVQFERRLATSNAWSTDCAYSPSTTCDLALASQGPGDYVVRALVRKQGSSAVYDKVSASRDFIVTDGRPLLRPLNLPGQGDITNVSADGRWFAVADRGLEGLFRWSRVNGFTNLGSLPRAPLAPSSAKTTGISDNGAVVVGISNGEHATEPFRWTSNKMTSLVSGSVYSNIALSTSSNGAVVVGWQGSSSGPEAFRWTAAAGFVRLGYLPGGLTSEAEDVSGDGSVVVGHSASAEGVRAFRWTAATGMVSLGVVPGEAKSSAQSVSRDGSVVVGVGDRQAFRYTAAEGMVNLGAPGGGGGTSFATGVSADGSKVIGYARLRPRENAAFLWTAATGMRFLSDVLADQGVDVEGWVLTSANDISPDGKTIVGSGELEGQGYVGWILTLP